MVARNYIRLAPTQCVDDEPETLELTDAGRCFVAELGLDVSSFDRRGVPLCRPCLDWSMRRYHLAGALGRALLEHLYRQRWARRVPDSRIVRFSARGEARFREAFGLG